MQIQNMKKVEVCEIMQIHAKSEKGDVCEIENTRISAESEVDRCLPTMEQAHIAKSDIARCLPTESTDGQCEHIARYGIRIPCPSKKNPVAPATELQNCCTA